LALLVCSLVCSLTRPLHAQVFSAWNQDIVEGLRASAGNDTAKAEVYFTRAVHEAEGFGPQDPRLGPTLNSLGLVYHARGKYRDEEAVYLRALAILLKVYGPSSLDVANVSLNLGTSYFDDGLYARSEPYFRDAWRIFDRSLGPDSIKTARAVFGLGETCRQLKRYAAAVPLLRQAADIPERILGLVNPETAAALNGLALAYSGIGKQAEAEKIFKLVSGIRAGAPGASSNQAGTLEAERLPRRTMQKP